MVSVDVTTEKESQLLANGQIHLHHSNCTVLQPNTMQSYEAEQPLHPVTLESAGYGDTTFLCSVSHTCWIVFIDFTALLLPLTRDTLQKILNYGPQ
jgi:hypothetical protein